MPPKNKSSSDMLADDTGTAAGSTSSSSSSSNHVFVQIGALYDETDSAKAAALAIELKALVKHRDASTRVGQLLVNCLVNRSASVRYAGQPVSQAAS